MLAYFALTVSTRKLKTTSTSTITTIPSLLLRHVRIIDLDPSTTISDHLQLYHPRTTRLSEIRGARINRRARASEWALPRDIARDGPLKGSTF